MMKRIVVHKPPAAKTLEDFDLDDEAIAKIVKNAHAERERVSPFAPRNARGTVFYDTTIAGTREHLVMSNCGWEMRCVNGLEVVEHAEKRLRIAYLSVTGTSGDMKSSPRGPVSIEAAATNEQISLLAFEWLAPTKTTATKVRRLQSAFETWFLSVEFVVDHYQVVLALPKEPDAECVRFVDWECRIRVADIPLDSQPHDDAIETPATGTTAPPKARRKKKHPSGNSGSSEATG